MNLQQLEYILAVDHYRHFAKAAEKSFVTQPTLSMMIRKLEDELGIKIFDRSRQPVTPTKEGEEILQRARLILAEAGRLKTYASGLQGEISGELRLAIIPTLAPYLLPLFLKAFSEKHPALKVYLKEMRTDEIINALKDNLFDIGILATPLHEQNLKEVHLFDEEFFAYATQSERLPRKKYLLPTEINPNHLWLLEEGHCLRNQVYNLCELKKQDTGTGSLHYEAGSIETLVNLVDKHHGITIIPQLATFHLKPNQRKNVREFAKPKPVRQISLVVAKNFPRTKLLESLRDEIVNSLPFKVDAKKKEHTTMDPLSKN